MFGSSATFRAILVFLLALPAAVSSAQRPASAESIAASGVFNGQEYSNAVLGFSMLAPGGWSFYRAEQNAAAVERNKQLAAKAGDAKLQMSAANTQVLFQAIPPAYAGQDKQAILSAGIERLTGPTTSAKYAADQKALVLASAQVHVTKDLNAINYGGLSFWSYDVEGSLKSGTYRQRCLITVRRGVAFFIVATFFNDKQEGIVDASLRSIKFK